MSPVGPMTSVLIADDHPVFRDGLRALLSSVGIEVIGEAASGREAVESASRIEPDVVVMDLHMPDMTGIEATRHLAASGCRSKILVLSMLEDDDSVFSALRAGASGYVLKDAGQEEIVRAIHAVAGGEAIFSKAIATRVLDQVAKPPVHSVFPQLTAREHEVLELIARGAGNAEIARKLFLSEKTIRNNVSNILTKLHVSARSEAIVKAREAGLGTERPE